MSAGEQSLAEAGPAGEANPVGRARHLENAKFTLKYLLPHLSRGMFIRSRRLQRAGTVVGFAYGLYVAVLDLLAGVFRRLGLGTPAGGQDVLDGLRHTLGECFYISVLGQRTLLVLDPAGIDAVLQRPPTRDFGAPRNAQVGFAHFQPKSLIVSHGPDHAKRRELHDHTLAANRFKGSIAAIIRREVALANRTAAPLRWADIDELARRTSLQVVFGEGNLDFDSLQRLDTLMKRSNLLVLVPWLRRLVPSGLAQLHQGFEAHLCSATTRGLAGHAKEFAALGQNLHETINNQISHWLFAVREGVSLNTVYTLALLVSHPHALRKATAEARDAGDLDDPKSIDCLRYLQACLNEAMRLWATTPLLVRRSDDAFDLPTSTASIKVPPNTQLMIHNPINHRDRARRTRADEFAPELWLNADGELKELRGSSEPPMNHFGNGARHCPGRVLVVFTIKSVLARLLRDHDYVDVTPIVSPLSPLPAFYDHFSVELKRLRPAVADR